MPYSLGTGPALRLFPRRIHDFRHQLNPAFSAERNYVSVPVLGNINVGTQGNVGVGKFLFPRNGELVTFMHSSVSGSKFLDGLRETNRLNADINLAILSAGFKAWGGYNTIGINLRSNTNMTLPRDLFAFMKMGMSKSETHYHPMDNLGIQSNNYFEIALGHSRKNKRQARRRRKAQVPARRGKPEHENEQHGR